jgi:hypothetical protein
MSENAPLPESVSAPDLLTRTHDVVSQLSKNFYKIGASLSAIPECGATKGLQELHEVASALRGAVERLQIPAQVESSPIAKREAEQVLADIRGELAALRALLDRLCSPPSPPPPANLTLNESDVSRLADSVANQIKENLPSAPPPVPGGSADTDKVLGDVRGEIAGLRVIVDRLCSSTSTPQPMAAPAALRDEDLRRMSEMVAGLVKERLPASGSAPANPPSDALLKELQDVRHSIETTVRAHLPKSSDSEVSSVQEIIRSAQKVIMGKMDIMEHKVDHLSEARPGSPEVAMATSARLGDELDKRLASMEKNLSDRMVSVSSYRRRLVLAGVLGLAIGAGISPLILGISNSQAQSATLKIETLLQQWTQATAEASRSLERRTGEMTQLLGQKVDTVSDAVRDLSVRLDTLQGPSLRDGSRPINIPPDAPPASPAPKEKSGVDADNELPSP